MKPINRIGTTCRRVARRLWVGAGVSVAAWLLAVAWSSATVLSESVEPPAWGSEALNTVRDQAVALAPISVANACGIGASSCFKCHNGTRAAAPKTDKKASPWHPDHKTVNDSCVGCHGGNARIIKKEIAHTNLAKDPRANPQACAKCHQSGNAPALLKSYQAAAAGGK